MTLEQAQQYFGNGARSPEARPSASCADIYQYKQALRDLEAQNDALREAMRRKDEFLATLGHELRNPLGAIANAAEVVNTSDASERAWATQIISRQTRQLRGLIDDLLDVARINQGKIALRKEPVDFAEVLDRAVETMRPAIAERQHTFVAAYPDGGELLLDGDAIRLEQIVVNLLANAVKYTPAGGEISLRATRAVGEISLAICDNGAGIPSENLSRIFELFAQGGRGTGQARDGLGIGLALVQKLTQLHGGSVSAASAGPGLGSTFIVRLPAQIGRTNGSGYS